MLDDGPMPMCECMLLLLWMLGRDWGELPGPALPALPAPRWCSPYDDGWPWPVGVFMGIGRDRGRVCNDDTGGRWTPASDWGEERPNGEYPVVLEPLFAPDEVDTGEVPPPPPAVVVVAVVVE